MNPYVSVATIIGSPEARALAERLSIWQDALVAHESRRGTRFGECGDQCPHQEAGLLLREAVRVFGERAAACELLRDHAGVDGTASSYATSVKKGTVTASRTVDYAQSA
jgi:hypothetical protein